MSRPDVLGRAIVPRALRRSGLPTIVLVVVFASVLPARGRAGTAGHEVTCVSASDCAGRLDPVAIPGGDSFVFQFGVKVLGDGLVLDVTTPNSIYVRGDLVTDGGRIDLTGNAVYVFDGTSIRDQRGSITPPALPPLRPGVELGLGGGVRGGGVITCACVTVLSLPALPGLPRLERLGGDDLRFGLAARTVLTGLAFPTSPLKSQRVAMGRVMGSAILIDRQGDIHIDASTVGWFERIDLAAGESLVIDGGGGGKLPIVPEPGVPMLLGLGLAALSRESRREDRTR